MDGWSAAILVQELLALYAQRRQCSGAAGGCGPIAIISPGSRRKITRLPLRLGGRLWPALREPTRVAPP